jgi:hypothetical protein
MLKTAASQKSGVYCAGNSVGAAAFITGGGFQFTSQRIALWRVETHGEVERPFRRRQPVRFLVSAGAFVLEIEDSGSRPGRI